MMKKNDIFILKIEDMGVGGEGIGKFDGFPFFVKDAVVGDTIEAKVTKLKKQYGYARLMKVIEPSLVRCEPRCAYAKMCGGCQLQALSYEAQLAFKAKKIQNNLIHIGGFTNIDRPEVIGMENPWRYRNKAQFPVGIDRDSNLVTGFYAARSHTIIPCTDCQLGVEENKTILEKILSHMKKYQIPAYDETRRRGLVRHILIRKGFFTGELMVCLILNGRKLKAIEELTASLQEIPGMTSITINVNTENTNVIMGAEIIPVFGQGYITDQIGDVKYQISPLSFYQVNPIQTEKLYQLALEYADLKGEETVWDLYCGIGTISLFLAQKAAKVYGVEVIPEAIEDARRNAKLNQIDNVTFYVGKAEEVLPEKYEKEGIYADVIVVDPPRKGCDLEALKTMIQMQPKRIVYVSCDSATLARDLKYLCERGYELQKVTGCDLFGWTVHVETVVLLSQQKPDDTIEIDLDLDELDATAAETKATYEEIKEYVLDKHHLKVSSLYISQIKRKCGLEVGQNYNLSKSENPKVPKCPPEKEAAIMDALRHFQMI